MKFICVICKTTKHESSFYKRRGTVFGFDYTCKVCRDKINRPYTLMASKRMTLDPKRNEMRSIRNAKYVATIKLRAINILGGKCVKCGYKNILALCVDHINSDGCKDLTDKGVRVKGLVAYRVIIKLGDAAQTKYQLLCANCNLIKLHKNGEHNGRNNHKYKQGIYNGGNIKSKG